MSCSHQIKMITLARMACLCFLVFFFMFTHVYPHKLVPNAQQCNIMIDNILSFFLFLCSYWLGGISFGKEIALLL